MSVQSSTAVNFDRVKQVITLPQITLSDAKVQRIALAFFAFVTFFIGNAAFSGGVVLSLLFGIPSYLLTAALAARCFRVKDYENPEELNKYREEAKTQGLMTIVKEHGWANLFKYKILSEEQFEKKFQDICKKVDAETVIDYYEKIHGVLKKLKIEFSVPHPSKCENTTVAALKNMKATEAYENFNIPLLIQYGMLSEDFCSCYDDWVHVQVDTKKAKKQCLEDFQNSAVEALKTFETAASKQPNATLEEKEIKEAWSKEIGKLKKAKQPTDWEAQVKQTQSSYEKLTPEAKKHWGSVKEYRSAQEEFISKAFELLTTYNTKIKTADSKLKSKIDQINGIFSTNG